MRSLGGVAISGDGIWWCFRAILFEICNFMVPENFVSKNIFLIFFNCLWSFPHYYDEYGSYSVNTCEQESFGVRSVYFRWRFAKILYIYTAPKLHQNTTKTPPPEIGTQLLSCARQFRFQKSMVYGVYRVCPGRKWYHKNVYQLKKRGLISI